MDWINYTLFTLGSDRPVILIDLLTSILGLVCVFLAGRNSKYNFWIGYLYTAFLFVMFWNKNLIASLILQPVSLMINILGHYRWTHPKKEEKSVKDASSLKVSMLTWSERLYAVIALFVIAGLWGWILDTFFPNDPHPYLDTCVTMLILIAQFLSAQKKWDCWVAWILVNITQLALHISVGHVFMPIVCALYLINGIWSLYSWKKTFNKGE